MGEAVGAIGHAACRGFAGVARTDCTDAVGAIGSRYEGVGNARRERTEQDGQQGDPEMQCGALRDSEHGQNYSKAQLVAYNQIRKTAIFLSVSDGTVAALQTITPGEPGVIERLPRR